MEKSKHEQLLSIDPIGAFEKIEKDYHLYFETTYKFSDKDLDGKKNDALKENNNLKREPLCELTPKYVAEQADLVDLCNPQSDSYKYPSSCKSLPDNFADFIACGLMRDQDRSEELGRNATYNPYKHQFEMLCKGYGQNKNVLITSGTGSGKTESFMLPLLASLLNEAKNWSSPNYNADWWRLQEKDSGKYVANQRFDVINQISKDNRPSAIRSLLLYPMNALVADQVARLRKALDSDNVRQFMEDNCNGNRIFFGSYNGNTIKEETKEVDKKSLKLLEDIATQSQGLAKATSNGECEPDDIYVAPRLNDQSFTSEMLVREDMQKTPPDILITNVSMLSIMLMRCEEQGMLNQTNDYYVQNPDAVFHLVVDELHLHRGTAGAEVAYLLRMFLHRIGVPPMKNGKPNPQLRIYASSASIENDKKNNKNSQQKYLEDFFGVYDPVNHTPQFEIQNGYDVLPIPTKRSLDYSKFDQFYLNNHCSKSYYEQYEHEQTRTKEDFLGSISDFKGSFEQFVEDYSAVIYRDLLHIAGAEWIEGTERFSVKPQTFEVSDLKNLPGLSSDKETSNAAIRGFLIFRGAFKNSILPSIRFHQFYKYIEGLWGELQPDSLNQGPIGELSYQSKEIANNGQHKMLELLRCECCGALFIGGNCNTHNAPFAMTLNSPDIKRIPNMQATPMVQRKKYNEYAVFYPSARSGNTNDILCLPESDKELHFEVAKSDGEINRPSDKYHGQWRVAWLNTCDGTVSYKNNGEPTIHGFVYEIFTKQEIEDKVLALPCQCPDCLKNYSGRKTVKSPIRSFRTGMGRNNQLLCKELLYQLDPKGNHAPKLIGFSDSRQDAAEQSKLIAKEHYRDMLRMIFIKIIKEK